MKVHGIETLSPAELRRELETGGRIVFYEYCISLVLLTLRRPSALYFLRGRETGLAKGLPYAVVSLLLGWWGIPWGFVYTPLALVTNLSGGCDVTAQILPQLFEDLSFLADKRSDRCDRA